jgi:hypothetical protein
LARVKSEKEKQKLQKLLTRIETSENWRDTTYRDRWTNYYKMWRNYVDPIKDKHGKVVTDRSNISVPYPFVQIETILPRLVETLFAGRPYVRVKGVPQSLEEYRTIVKPIVTQIGQQSMQEVKKVRPWEAAANKMETLLDYQQNVVFDIQDVFHIGLKILALYGTTVGFSGWKYKTRTQIRKELQQVMQPDPLDPESMLPTFESDGVTPVTDWKEIETKVKEYDDPEVEFLDLGLFFVDPNAKDIDDSRYCGHVDYLSKDELEAMAEADPDMKLEWKKIPKESKKNEARNHRMSAIGIPDIEINESADQQDADHLFEVHYYWEDDRYCIIINRGYLAKDVPNPFWHKKKPYDKETYVKVPGEFYGIGICEVIEHQWMELNTERNQRIDYRSMSLRRMFKYRKDANINRSELVWRQGGFIGVEDMNDIDTFDVPSITGDTFNQEETIKQDIRDATGAHDVVMGASSGGTATEAMRNDNNAAMRFRLIISSVEKRLLVAISRKMIQLNQQFIDDIRLLPLFDKDDTEWPEISPEEIQGEFHLIAAGSSVEPMANKEAFKQRMVELYGVVANNPFWAQYPEKHRNFLKKLFEAFDFQETDDFLPSDSDMQGAMQNQIIGQFIASLPPQLQQVLAVYLQQSGGGDMPPEGAATSPMNPVQTTPPAVTEGGANTAMMQEAGMDMVGVGGGLP